MQTVYGNGIAIPPSSPATLDIDCDQIRGIIQEFLEGMILGDWFGSCELFILVLNVAWVGFFPVEIRFLGKIIFFC